MQFAGLSTFLPTKARTLETKYDHGLTGHRLDQSPADLNVLDGNSVAGDVPIVPLPCNDGKRRLSPAVLTATQSSPPAFDSHGPLGTGRSRAYPATRALFPFDRSVRERWA